MGAYTTVDDRAPPFPYCAVCRHPVQEMEWWDDFVTNCRVVKAKCHGQVETTHIPYSLFMSARFDIKPGIAFIPKPELEK